MYVNVCDPYHWIVISVVEFEVHDLDLKAWEVRATKANMLGGLSWNWARWTWRHTGLCAVLYPPSHGIEVWRRPCSLPFRPWPMSGRYGQIWAMAIASGGHSHAPTFLNIINDINVRPSRCTVIKFQRHEMPLSIWFSCQHAIHLVDIQTSTKWQGDDFENLPLAKGARGAEGFWNWYTSTGSAIGTVLLHLNHPCSNLGFVDFEPLFFQGSCTMGLWPPVGHLDVIWLGSQQKLQRILKRHTLQLNAVGMKALLEALDKGAGPG